MTRNSLWPLLLAAPLAIGLAGCGKEKTGDRGIPRYAGSAPPGASRPRTQAQQEASKDNLRRIGFALHNHHDAYRTFPAMDSNGLRGPQRKAGLSWRVWLLPYLDQRPLFEQFKLDEPWDSPHNKQLIPHMPQVYARPGSGDSSGKTAIHVFVGNNNTPFGIQAGGVYVGPRLRDLVDGSSNTILVVETGPDKADVWTKPGGLPFDPAGNPVGLLGAIPDEGFLALLADGSVRIVRKTVAPDILKLLIQHNDRQEIPQR